MMVRRTVTSAATLCVIAAAAACSGGSDPETNPPLSSSSVTTTPPSTDSTTAAPPPWQSKYTSGQVRLYNAALQRWTDYERRSEPIWAKGRATPTAKGLFQEYFLNWKHEFQTLQTYQQGDIKVLDLPTIYWSRPTSISEPSRAGRHGTSTLIRQCVDYRPQTVTAKGKPSRLAPKFRRPLIREISMIKLGTTWLTSSVDDLTDGKARPCDPRS